jgi:hypothetical protein
MTQTATDFPALDREPIEKLAIDTIRTLCIDAVRQPTPATLVRPWHSRR